MKAILSNTWKILHPRERRRFTLLIALEVFMNLADIISLVALIWIVKLYVSPANDSELSFLPAWTYDRTTAWPIGIFLVLFALKNLAGFLITRSTNRFIGEVAVRISMIHLENYQQAPFDEFVSVDSSVHIRRIAFQPYEFCQYILAGIQQVITQFSLILLAITAILLFNAKLFLLLLLMLLPPALLVFYLVKRASEKNRKGIQNSNEKSFRYLLDALKGYVEGNIYGRNHFFMERFIRERRTFSNYLFRSASLQSLPARFIEVFAILGLFLLVLISKYSSNSSSTLVLVGAFMAAAYKIIPGIVKIINAAGLVKAYEFALNELVNEKITSENATEPVEPGSIESIQVKKVHFFFGHSPVLKDFNLCVQAGDFIGITGYSGIGKTTVLNLLTGLLKPDSGEILINGEQMKGINIKKYWPQISYVRQQSFLINDSILRNLVLDEGEFDKRRLESIIEITGLDHLISAFPEGIEMQITENGKNISGGQQQRISIARALYHDARLYLLDEPFNELDEESEAILLRHFQMLSQEGRMVVMVTHNQKALAFCNKIITLNG